MTTLATWLADPSFRARLVDALADAIVAHTLRTIPSPSRSGASPGVRPAPLTDTTCRVGKVSPAAECGPLASSGISSAKTHSAANITQPQGGAR